MKQLLHASLLITLILAILVWKGHIQYWHILIMATALGFVNTLDMPARQSFVRVAHSNIKK